MEKLKVLRVRCLWICLLSAAVLFVPAVTIGLEDAPAAKDIVAAMQAAYGGVESLSADFSQRVISKATGREKKERGVVSFRKPAKMFWRYTAPEEKLLIIGPENSWFYLPRQKIAYKQASSGLLSSPVVMGLLRGEARIATDFKAALVEASPTSYTLRLVPVGDIGAKEIVIKVERQRFLITSCAFEDAYGNYNAMTFENIFVNTEVTDDLFRFVAPTGVQIVDWE